MSRKQDRYSYPALTRNLTDVEAAWLGAMLDAEGTIYRNGATWAMVFLNSEVEYISAFLRLTGQGKVYYRAPRPPGKLVLWEWRTGRSIEVAILCQRLAPWSLKARRVPALARKYRRVLGLSNREKTHCQQGHEYTKENTYFYLGRKNINGSIRQDRRCRACDRAR